MDLVASSSFTVGGAVLSHDFFFSILFYATLLYCSLFYFILSFVSSPSLLFLFFAFIESLMEFFCRSILGLVGLIDS